MICPVLDFLQIWRNRMRRTEQLQGLRLMKFEDVYGRCYRGDLSQAEASEILGMSERTFRRWRERYEAEGAEGIVTLTAWLRHGRCFSVSGCARYPTVVTAFHRSSSSMPSGSIAVSR